MRHSLKRASAGLVVLAVSALAPAAAHAAGPPGDLEDAPGVSPRATSAVVVTSKPAVLPVNRRAFVVGRVSARALRSATQARVRVVRLSGPGQGGSASPSRTGLFRVSIGRAPRAGTARFRVVFGARRGPTFSVRVIPRPPGPGTGVTHVVAPARILAAPAPGTGGTVRLAAGASAPAVGDTLNAGIGPRTPYGMLLRVISVRISGGAVVAGTVPAKLHHVLPAGRVAARIPVTTRAPSGRITPRAPGGSATPPCTGSVSPPTIDGEAEFEGTVEAEVEWAVFKPERVELVASASASASASVTASAAGSCTLSGIEILDRKLTAVPLWVGPLFVVLVPEVEVELSGSINAQAQMGASVSAGISARAGLIWENGEFTKVAEINPQLTHSITPPQAGGSATGTVTAELSVLLYGAAGAKVTIASGLELTADTAREPWWWLDGSVSANASLEVPILDRESGSLELYDRTFRLAEAASREPRYRVLAGSLRSVASASGSCSGGVGCSYPWMSQTYSQSTDASFSVASPGPYQQGAGNFAARAAIESWTHAYSRSQEQERNGCRVTQSSVDSGPLVHTGGTNPSDYSLIGFIDKPLAGEPITRPKVGLRVNTGDLGNLMTNQPALGITWPYSLQHKHTMVQSTDSHTQGGIGCEAGSSSNTRLEPVLSRFPFDPLHRPFKDIVIYRTEVNGPTVYGAPACNGRLCVTRVSGMTGFDDVQRDGPPSTASVRVTWWFDVESCLGC